jgi:transposase-like protein
MGLSSSEQELKKIAAFIEELELRNTRPLDPDWLALFLDGKYVEIRDGDRLKPACIYLVVGLGRDGKKRVLACLAKSSRENLEDWKLVLRSLPERGRFSGTLAFQDVPPISTTSVLASNEVFLAKRAEQDYSG